MHRLLWVAGDDGLTKAGLRSSVVLRLSPGGTRRHGSPLEQRHNLDQPRVGLYDGRVIGDRVEIVVDTGAGVQTYSIVATRAGRRVEVSTSRGVVEVTEVTRTGQAVRTGRFMASRVVALVEHPAEADRSKPRRSRNPNQSELL